ncbi:MAG: outer membrane beta-barrel protein [Cyclobacteriaceae bacterium]|nr:outer membrane beta-barrel protein [Cyclobacteriaceae bacterium]
MEREKFEDSWKDAFKDAEANPSENLWTSIELDLEKANGDVMKRRVLFFKLLAAASVVFAMCFGGLYLYEQRNLSNSSQVSFNKIQAPESMQDLLSESAPYGTSGSPKGAEGTQKYDAHTVDNSSTHKDQNSVTLSVASKGTLSGKTKPFDKSTQVSVIPAGLESQESYNNSGISQSSKSFLLAGKPLPPLVLIQRLKVALPEKESDPVELMLARLAKEESKYREEENKKKKNKNNIGEDENLWTSVGFSAGSFNTVTSGTSDLNALGSSDFTSSIVVSNNAADNQSKASGFTYSAGLSVGTKVAERWVLQGGVNYLSQSSSYTTNAVISSPNQPYKAASITALNALENYSSGRIINTTPYDVNNSLQYISVPMQAGYLLINRDFGVQLNAGVSTDLFLQNTITPQESGIAKSTQGSGENSPYRSVNFIGLMGTEISYRVGQHYRLSVNPGLRYPFSSMYKSELGVDAMPITFDVGLRFRYIFH